jgi:alanine racemase
MWDEAVIMGRQGGEEISVHEMARLKNTVSYDVLTAWRLRLRRKVVNAHIQPQLLETAANSA